MSLKPKVALAQDFLAVLAKLPNAEQGKILKWAIRFQSDPTSSGINYENINAARDANLKSVRIDLLAIRHHRELSFDFAGHWP